MTMEGWRQGGGGCDGANMVIIAMKAGAGYNEELWDLPAGPASL